MKVSVKQHVPKPNRKYPYIGIRDGQYGICVDNRVAMFLSAGMAVVLDNGNLPSSFCVGELTSCLIEDSYTPVVGTVTIELP